MAEKLRGEQGFEAHYAARFGERWSGLKAALLSENQSVIPFDAGKKIYYLDSASVLAAMSLPLNGSAFLDMCAAPGGKTLVLANRISLQNARSGKAAASEARAGREAQTGREARAGREAQSEAPAEPTLVANERSYERMKRLERVVQEHLPEDLSARVKITCGDGAVLCKKNQDFYDAVFLDAPCSSERHVLLSKPHLAKWSPSRIRSLAVEQWALLSSAFRLLKRGGYLLYSTCALCDEENSLVVSRLLKKFGDSARIAGEDEVREIQREEEKKAAALLGGAGLPSFERAQYGFNILPDAQGGAGPIYFCLVQKTGGGE